MGRVVGIDLGTTNSCVAIVDGGTPSVIPNKGGYKTTPSIVAVSESGRRLVGQMAKRQAITNAKHTVYASKRLIGRKWGTPPVVNCVETCSYEIVPGPHDDVRIRLRGKEYSLPEISSIILQEMKLVAEEYTGEEVTQAVVTVPAYFTDAQRKATMDAGVIADLEILRIINEPTSAALAYGYGRDIDATVAIFDLGGGTFDISVLEISHGVFDVLSTAGDTFLGGEDFDARIIEHLAFEFAREHSIDLRGDEMSLQRLRDAAEKAKIELTTMQSSEISLPFIFTSEGGEALHLHTTLTREKFEDLVADLVHRTIKICEATLREADLGVEDIDEVIIVGGMTRMPKIQDTVREYFGCDPAKSVHPDEAIAVGAAIQAHSLVMGDRDVVLLDVTPHSLGIMVHGGGFEKIIEANSTIPTEESHTFTTIRENQTSVKIIVFQGESIRADENELLGEFVLSGIRNAPAGSVEIDVTFDISVDGIVSVSARDKATGNVQSITVTATSGLTDDEIENMIAENQDYLVQLKEGEDLESHRANIRRMIREMETWLAQLSTHTDGWIVGACDSAKQNIENAKLKLENDHVPELAAIESELQQAYHSLKGAIETI